MKPVGEGALVLFSGGQESTTCLAWALDRFERVETVGLDYRQRHRVELECRGTVLAEARSRFPRWRNRLGEDHMVGLSVLAALSDTALTREVEIEMGRDGLPTTFVPGRNLLFVTFAAVIGYRRGLSHLVGGVCETDFSGYPDCRDDTLKAMQLALKLGMAAPFTVDTLLMWIDKADTWWLAADLGGEALLDLIREHTHTCYFGDRTRRHEWGYGCNECPACQLRARGYREYRERAQASTRQ